jgi:hypothetical protein
MVYGAIAGETRDSPSLYSILKQERRTASSSVTAVRGLGWSKAASAGGLF